MTCLHVIHSHLQPPWISFDPLWHLWKSEKRKKNLVHKHSVTSPLLVLSSVADLRASFWGNCREHTCQSFQKTQTGLKMNCSSCSLCSVFVIQLHEPDRHIWGLPRIQAEVTSHSQGLGFLETLVISYFRDFFSKEQYDVILGHNSSSLHPTHLLYSFGFCGWKQLGYQR